MVIFWRQIQQQEDAEQRRRDRRHKWAINCKYLFLLFRLSIRWLFNPNFLVFPKDFTYRHCFILSLQYIALVIVLCRSISFWYIGIGGIFMPFTAITFAFGNNLIIRVFVGSIIVFTLVSQELAKDASQTPTLPISGTQVQPMQILITASHLILVFHSLGVGALVFSNVLQRRRLEYDKAGGVRTFRWSAYYSFSAPIISVLGNSTSVVQSILAVGGREQKSKSVKMFISAGVGWVVTGLGMIDNGEDLYDIGCVVCWVVRKVVMAVIVVCIIREAVPKPTNESFRGSINAIHRL
jgi:hypothetical protein